MAEPRPLLLLAVPVALGAWSGADATLATAWILAGLAGLLLLLVLAAGRVFAPVALAGAAFAVAAGAAAAESAQYDAAPLRRWVIANEDGDVPVRLRGVAAADGRAAGDRVQIVLEVETLELGGQVQACPGRARLDVGGSPTDGVGIIEGDRLEAWAVLRVPHGFGTPGAYDAAAQARRDGVHAFGSVKSRRLVAKAGRGGVNALRDVAARARRRAR